MERDFLGLNIKETLTVVKEEVNNDGYKDLGFSKGSGIQWPFSNKVSALPHLMSFKVAQDNKSKKIVTDALVSSGLMSISNADAYDCSQKRSTADIQMFPVTNQAISVSVSNPFFKNHFATSGPNPTGATMKPQGSQLLGGIPVTTPHSILPNIGSVGLVTEPSVKASGSPAQLTIFYAGTVNVYDDISPEKAQAIMFLAGNGSLNMAHPKVHVQAPASKLAAGDCNPANQPINSPPSSGLSSPLSVSSHTGAQSGSGSTSTDELMVAKTTGVATTPVSKMDPPKTVNAMGSVATTTMIPSAVPQARKASLARFLEKRKERVMNAAPYNLGQKSQECATPDCNGINFSAAVTGSLGNQGEKP